MTKKSNNSILAFQKTVRFRYFYRGLCTLILTAFALAMFLVIWIDYVKDNNHTGFLSGIGNIGLASIIYVVLFLICICICMEICFISTLPVCCPYVYRRFDGKHLQKTC